LIGDAASNRLDGGPGDDHLQAVGGGDDAFGGPGSDTCVGGFASQNSCGAGPGDGSAVVVELIASIDNFSSLVITGTAGPDSVNVSHNGGAYLADGPGGASVISGDGSCAQASSASVSCGGSAHRILAAMGGGDDTLTLNGTPRGVHAVLDGGPGSDNLTGGPGRDFIYGGDDRVPDTLSGGGEDDILFGVNTAHPRQDSGAATMFGGPGDDILVGGQPCDGDFFSGGPGGNDTASFARIRNSGTFVHATIGGAVRDPDIGNCNMGRIDGTVERIEGSPGPDVLIGDNSANTLLGRGGNDFLDGKGGYDRCIGGGGRDRAQNCEQLFSIP
jgi:Ca2+-binding RTX toxin-like protein